jgi:hypothetical protein
MFGFCRKSDPFFECKHVWSPIAVCGFRLDFFNIRGRKNVQNPPMVFSRFQISEAAEKVGSQFESDWFLSSGILPIVGNLSNQARCTTQSGHRSIIAPSATADNRYTKLEPIIATTDTAIGSC